MMLFSIKLQHCQKRPLLVNRELSVVNIETNNCSLTTNKNVVLNLTLQQLFLKHFKCRKRDHH